MLVGFWAPKGGSGVSVVAATAAILVSRRGPVTLVDLAGDADAVFGLAIDPVTGVRDWLALGADAAAASLDRIEVAATPTITVLPRGGSSLAAGAADVTSAVPTLLAALRRRGHPVVVDLGTASDPVARELAEGLDALACCVRPCYLALRRAIAHPLTARSAGVVVIGEAGRALGTREISSVLEVSVLATVAARPAVARAVDAGMLAARVPEVLARPLHRVVDRLFAGVDAGASR